MSKIKSRIATRTLLFAVIIIASSLFVPKINAQQLFVFDQVKAKSKLLKKNSELFVKTKTDKKEESKLLLGTDSGFLYFETDTVRLSEIVSVRFCRKEIFNRICAAGIVPVLTLTAIISMDDRSIPVVPLAMLLGVIYYTPVLLVGAASDFTLYEFGKNAKFIYLK